MCMVISGDYPIDINWLKDGKPLSDPRQQSNKLDESTVILSMRRLSLEDSGNYTCVAGNRAGSVMHSAILKVKGIEISILSLLASLPVS